MAVLLSLLLTFSFAHAEIPLPVVSAADFTVGRSWIWDYFDQTGAIYSTEKYTVISLVGSVVVIEMASDYGGGQSLKPHTRLRVDVTKCLRAYRNPTAKQAWSFQMFYLSAGRWTEFDQPNTLAFEEKFNCNPREYSSPSAPYLTEYAEIDGVRVFQQKLYRRLTGSWFAMTGPQMAVAVRKEFNADPAMSYTFRLRP